MSLKYSKIMVPALALALNLSLYAQESYTTHTKSLKEAIENIAKQANLPYIADGKLLENKSTKPITNITDLQSALDEVLEGSNLKAVIQEGTILIVEKERNLSNTTLEVIDFVANVDNSTEGTGSYTTNNMNSATKLNLSMRDTPQSVSVMTHQQIEDFGLTTLDDAMKNITGLVVKKGYHSGDSGSFTARGFQISNILLDGMPISTESNGTYNADNDSLDIYDRVEVVRGATGLTTGTGTPSATVNLVRKNQQKRQKEMPV